MCPQEDQCQHLCCAYWTHELECASHGSQGTQRGIADKLQPTDAQEVGPEKRIDFHNFSRPEEWKENQNWEVLGRDGGAACGKDLQFVKRM